MNAACALRDSMPRVSDSSMNAEKGLAFPEHGFGLPAQPGRDPQRRDSIGLHELSSPCIADAMHDSGVRPACHGAGRVIE